MTGLSSMLSPEWKAPLQFRPGPPWDVLNITLHRVASDIIWGKCVVEAQERSADQTFIEFIVYFYYSAFDGDRLNPHNPESLLATAREQVWKHLYENRQRRARSRWIGPVKLEVR